MVKIRSPREITDQLDRWIEQGRKALPLMRGGDGRKKVKPVKPRKPQPLPKTFQHTPTIPSTPAPTGDAVRWRQPPQEMTRVTMKDDVLDVLNNAQDDIEAEQIAQDIYQAAEQTQNQEMEDALASIEGRRPRQFQNARANSRQFSRANLLRAPEKKRKVSAYSKRFGVELKKLKKLHPRTKIQNLMKKAHRRTRAAMKKK
jgi:hypothetical protein